MSAGLSSLPFFEILTAEITTRPTAATKNQLHHEGHEEHEGVFINVSITLVGVGALRGLFLLYCEEIAA
jgi:hypothetical protein